MHQLFARANEALHRDLAGYADALRLIIAALPEARELGLRAVREARLVQAILAFGNGSQVAELGQIAFHLTNLWVLRDNTQPRTSGFDEELNETFAACEHARRGIALLGHRDDDGLSAELRLCFQNILRYLEDQLRVLEQCQQRLRPFSSGPELTRKRLNLLVAAAEARLPDSPNRQIAVRTYTEATALLQEWDGGLPLDGRGVAVLERCLDIINQSSSIFGVLTMPSFAATQIEA
ncbi:MAG: hypothetical protein HC822_14155 [Oscillochloris sp.]|nr:hypothetical protein [Oscillochloris sp.]